MGYYIGHADYIDLVFDKLLLVSCAADPCLPPIRLTKVNQGSLFCKSTIRILVP